MKTDGFGDVWKAILQQEGGQEERRDAEWSLTSQQCRTAVASPLGVLPTGLAQRHRRHGKHRVATPLD